MMENVEAIVEPVPLTMAIVRLINLLLRHRQIKLLHQVHGAGGGRGQQQQADGCNRP